jgi:stage V sporulation protein G
MDITEVRVFPVDEDKLKAYASIVLDRCFIINDLKIIQGKRGLFISMPSRRRKRGGYRDVAHPLNNETRQMVEERVLAEYEAALASGAPLVSGDGLDEAQVSVGEGEWQEPLPLAAAPVEAPSPAAPAGTASELSTPPSPAPQPAGDRSLEEVEELHLRDSFWSVS